MAKNTGPTPAQRHAVIKRDGGRCVACGLAVVDPETFEPWQQYSLQHRKARGMGGTSKSSANDPANLVLMCGTGTTGCHGKAEHNPTWAAENGYRVASWEDPAAVPFTHYALGSILLAPSI